MFDRILNTTLYTFSLWKYIKYLQNPFECNDKVYTVAMFQVVAFEFFRK